MEEFKFKCFPVLPLIYDESLSYYEVLMKVTEKLNEIIRVLPGYEDQSSAIEELQQFETWARGKINDLEPQVANNTAEITAINDTLDTIEDNIESLQTLTAGHSDDISALQTDNASNKERLTALETSLSADETLLNTLNADNTINKLNISTLQTTVGSLSTAVYSMVSTVAQHTTDIGTLQTQTSTLNTTVSGINGTVGALSATSAQHTAQIDSILGGNPTLAGWISYDTLHTTATIHNDIISTGISKMVKGYNEGLSNQITYMSTYYIRVGDANPDTGNRIGYVIFYDANLVTPLRIRFVFNDGVYSDVSLDVFSS